jgi:hypothetical protein
MPLVNQRRIGPHINITGIHEGSELVNKSPREARGLLGVSGKARESQYLGV